MNDIKLQSPLLTMFDVSKLLQVPVKTIRNWVYKGRIPNVKINGHVRFRTKDIETMVNKSMRDLG